MCYTTLASFGREISAAKNSHKNSLPASRWAVLGQPATHNNKMADRSPPRREEPRPRSRSPPRRSRSPGARDAGGAPKRGEFGGEGGPRKSGVCVAWNHKGFGFIRPDDGGGDDLFCHATQIRDGFLRRPVR